ncbi:MAG: isopentenyl-diphosphate Delta-isomerase [Chitinophagaceae bacterium]|nr:isopentenyl-diphosphate Delta-isomerase [Chitinophagaceae bacterium]
MEQLILVNELDEMVGTMEKMEAHQKALLHRAFSIFIFNSEGEMLLQQRAVEKYHCGGLWTNTCCSHPRPEEDTAAAALRRLQEEMGFATSLKKVFDFVYKAPFANGLTEYEFDHVFFGRYDGNVEPNPREVAAVRYLKVETIQSMMEEEPNLFTPWFHIAFPKMMDWLSWQQVA